MAIHETCLDCTAEVPFSAEECPVCKSRKLGFPNVRWAERTEERAALAARIAQVQSRAAADGRSPEVRALGASVSHSKAVMNRALAVLDNWVNGNNPLFESFFKQIQAGRVPNGSEWDEQRGAAEQTVNPWCYQDLTYAALTINDRGMSYYGDYAVILNTATISARASVFEENPFYFNARHSIISGQSPPFGFRAGWHNRSALAVAKLGDRVPKGATSAEIASLVMEQNGSKPNCDFIEVHIHGSLHRQSIAKVVGPMPKRGADKALWRRVVKKLGEAGAVVEQIA